MQRRFDHPLAVILLPALIGAVCVVALSGCWISRPSVSQDRKVASMPHVGTMLQNCASCHADRLPKGIIQEFDHAVSVVKDQDCASCHVAGAGLSWAGGKYDHVGIKGAALTSCVGCHGPQIPKGFAKEFDHAAVINASGALVDSGGQCAQCHTHPGVAWNDGVLHAAMSVTTNCNSCHTPQRPAMLVGTPPFDHTYQVGMGDCAGCHAQVGVSWKGGTYSHMPVPTTCSYCHSTERPLATALLPAGGVNDLYVHTTGFNGTTDCLSCHSQVAANIGIKWAGGNYNHKDNNGMAVPVCLPCHQNQKPLGPIGTPVFDHSTTGAQDCGTCHKNAGVAWTGGGYDHKTPPPTTCTGCHMGSVPAATTLVPITATIDLYQHQATFKGNTDCVNCHIGVPANLGVKWAGGNYDHKTIGGTLISSTCLPCHQNQRPTVAVGTNPPYDHKNGGMGDCATCHTKAGVAWTGGMYSHNPVPTTCSSCHMGEVPAAATLLPAGATKNLFAHSMSFNGTSDCVSCHTSVVANVGVNWTGGTYNHKGSTGMAVATCFPCHQGEKPTAPIGNPAFDHSSIGAQDCATCHKQPGVVWSGASGFNHVPTPTSCSTCHSAKLPLPTTLLPAAATIDLYEHAATFNGTSDCVACHTKVVANIGVNWAGGNYDHKTTGGAFISSTCMPCHQGQRPSGNVGNPPFNHATSGMGDCASCHKNSGVSWTGGTFSHTPAPTTCSSCHASQLPGPTVILPAGATLDTYEHAAMFNGTGDCVSCHVSVTANIGVRWAGGNYNHKDSSGALISSTCYPCHQNQRPVGAVGNPSFNHSMGGTGDCASCHKSPGVSWTGGLFSHNPVPTTCASCHASQVPKTTVPSTVDGFNHAVGYGTECYACHTVVPTNIGVSWTKGFFGHNGNNAASFTSCSPCHDTRRHKAGTNCTSCHKQVTWPKASPTGNYGGAFGGA